MTYDQIISTAMTRLGNRPGLRTSIEAELELIVTAKLEGDPQFKPWFLLYEDLQSIPTVNGQSYVDAPADFLWEYDDGFLFSGSAGNLSEVRKNSYEVLAARFAGVANGLPTNYSLIGGRIHLFPTPDSIYTLLSRYYKTSGTLNNTNPWVVYAPDLLIAEVTMIMAINGQNEGVATVQAGLAKAARDRIMKENTERALVNQDERFGDGP